MVEKIEEEQKIEEIKKTLATPGWKMLVEYFVEEQKEGLRGLLENTPPTTPEGVSNILHYQAKISVIDDFFLSIADEYIDELEVSLEERKGGQK